ncbi:MAG: phosphoglucomutase [Saprospiraceae bacterium]|jgi:phosphoglucomutase
MNGLEPSVLTKVNEWLNGNYDEATKAAIRQMVDNKDVGGLTDAFYKDLEFGTGGLRGIMGVGSNRVNKYTLGKATQGFSNYLVAKYPGEELKVVIAHDCRNNSDVFAGSTADIFSANGIKVYYFDALRPTPELSFAIRELGCHGGVMLTASHNPKEYNGYKAYDKYGCQLVAPADKTVMSEVQKVDSNAKINFSRNTDLVETIGVEMDEKFYAALEALSIDPEMIARQKDLKIVFSPIHGTGGVSVPPVLKRFGFENVILVEEQMTYDGNFPTVIYPNPEEKEALSMGLAKAKAVDADLLMATDPDADRVGIAVKNTKGEFELLNGNQVASMMILYVLTAWEKAGKLTDKEYIVKTIVTTYLIDKIAAAKNVDCFNVLTGFKYIGEMMTKLEGDRYFLAGGEESYGYLVGEHARDKDAVIACAMIAEMVAYHKDNGSSLYEALMDVYEEYGFYLERLVSLKKEGKAGAEEIQAMLKSLRGNTPATLGGSKVTMVKDYLSSESKEMATSEITKIDLPSANVLQFFLEDGSIISARPSGTEPKVKFYCSVNTELADKADYDKVKVILDNRLDAILKDLGV